jgi:hypothetical protein
MGSKRGRREGSRPLRPTKTGRAELWSGNHVSGPEGLREIHCGNCGQVSQATQYGAGLTAGRSLAIKRVQGSASSHGVFGGTKLNSEVTAERQ